MRLLLLSALLVLAACDASSPNEPDAPNTPPPGITLSLTLVGAAPDAARADSAAADVAASVSELDVPPVAVDLSPIQGVPLGGSADERNAYHTIQGMLDLVLGRGQAVVGHVRLVDARADGLLAFLPVRGTDCPRAAMTICLGHNGALLTPAEAPLLSAEGPNGTLEALTWVRPVAIGASAGTVTLIGRDGERSLALHGVAVEPVRLSAPRGETILRVAREAEPRALFVIVRRGSEVRTVALDAEDTGATVRLSTSVEEGPVEVFVLATVV
jgi:hypothetical protein